MHPIPTSAPHSATVSRLGALCAAFLSVVATAETPATTAATRFTVAALSLEPGAVVQSAASTDTPPPPTDAAPVHRRYGTEGMVTFNIFGDAGTDFTDDWFGGAQIGISWFFIDDLSLDLQLEQYGISQEGPNAYAIGPALLMRWHFLSYETWSLYADAGCGVIYATNPVPFDGSRFNFTPRIGIGASIGITDTARILTGVRWFHISNANTSTPNPGRDSLELYAGISLAF